MIDDLIGIKAGYPRIRKRLGDKISAYLQLLRPLTMTAPLLGGLLGGLMGYRASFDQIPILFDREAWLPIIFATVNLLMIQGGNNILNQAAEADLDAISKPYRPIPRGLATRDEGFALAMILYVVASFRSTLINEMFGLLSLSLIVLTVTYSMKPLYLKARLWWGNLNLAVARGALGILAAYSVYGDPFTPLPLSMALILAVFVFGANSTKDRSDMIGDIKFGIVTLYTKYGVRTAGRIISPFFVTPFILTPAFVGLGWLHPETMWILTLLPLAIYGIHQALVSETRLPLLTENVREWVVFYAMLAGMFIIFTLSYILA